MGRTKRAVCRCGHPYTEHMSAKIDTWQRCVHVHRRITGETMCTCVRYERRAPRN